jgi:hypothetical protein
VTDFRDHHIKKALDEAIGAYRPEKTRRSRLKRVAIVALLALVTVAGFWTALYHSTPKPAKPAAERRPVPVQILPAPAKR